MTPRERFFRSGSGGLNELQRALLGWIAAAAPLGITRAVLFRKCLDRGLLNSETQFDNLLRALQQAGCIALEPDDRFVVTDRGLDLL